MPEWNEKKKQWETREGSPISSAQMAEQKRTTSYLYDMYNLGKNARNIQSRDPKTGEMYADPGRRADLLGDLQKNLQAQYYGRKGLGEDYIKSDTDVTVEKSRGQTLRDVADTTGKYQVEATKAGVPPPGADLTDLAERLLGGGSAGGGGIQLAGDKEGPVVPPTLGAPVDKEKKKKEDDIKRRLGVLAPKFSGEVGGGLNFGIAERLFKKPEDEDFFR